MKATKLFFMMLACSMFFACSNDDATSVTPTFKGSEAYINVRLADASSLTKGADGGYEYSADEHAVTNAFFYFYDAAGQFVSEGSAWNGGTENPGNQNIEFKGNNVVVLKGLEEKNYPTCMVTVLNKPEGFVAPQSLDDMEAALAGGIFTTSGETNYFIMSTTSYDENTNQDYFVTDIAEENFSLEPVPATPENCVTVYVERLAAKVTLDASDAITNKVTIGDRILYQIKATVAGDFNDEDVNNNATNQTASEDLFIEFLGWKLNGTANDSYMVKNINTEWAADAFDNFGWNKAADFRSFWGKSYNYGDASYTYSAPLAENEKCPLTYTNLADNLVELSKSAYAAENTNTVDILTKEGNFPQAVTSILLKAQVCDKEGKALDLVRFNGVLFKKEQFVNYVLKVATAKNNLNAWTKGTDADGNDVYTSISAANVELSNVGAGVIEVKLVAGQTLFAKDGDSYSEIADQSSVNTVLAEESKGATAYTGGLMYYNIPIEHLNEIEADQKDTHGLIVSKLEEANYGVVRNHHYVVTVNKVETLGKGIYDPNEVIVPTPDDEETYYVGAQINILSWKIVSQSVDL